MSAHGSALSAAAAIWGGCTGLAGLLVATFFVSPLFQPCKATVMLPGVDPSPFDVQAPLPAQCDFPMAAELGAASPAGLGVLVGGVGFVLAYVIVLLYESATAPPHA